MSRIGRLSGVLLCTSIIGIVGCRSKEPAKTTPVPATNEGPILAPPKQSTTPATPQADNAALPGQDEPAASETAVAAKIKANLASFSDADRALVEKQKVCPVSGGALGAMGPPKKLVVAGHEVFICCAGCEKALTSQPEKYLAKLGLEAAQK